jgi:preprotein translocase subunit YajC
VDQLVILAAFLVLMYLVLIRPQQKQQKARKELLSQVSTGDDVVTIGGLHGTVVETGEGPSGAYIDLMVTDDVVLRFKRDAVANIVSDAPETPDVVAEDAFGDDDEDEAQA